MQRSMEESFYQPLQSHEIACYQRLHSEFSERLIDPVLRYYRDLQSTLTSRKIGLAVDVGCEVGQVSALLSKVSENVLGVDLAPEMVNEACKLNSQPNIRYEVCSADCLSTQCPEQTADIVVAAMAGHFFDTKEFHKEAERCLRPGGVGAVVAFWCRGFQNGNVQQRHIFDHFVKWHLESSGDMGARLASTKLMSFYRDLNLPSTEPSSLVRLQQKHVVEWNRQDVTAYFYANRHLFGGDIAVIDEFTANPIFDEVHPFVLNVFGWMWQI